MKCILYHNASDARVINKVLIGGLELEGELRDEMAILTPTVRIQSSDVLDYNYMYIPDLHRYYSVTAINAYRKNVYDIDLAVDVLMSYRGEIMTYSVIVDKQSMPENGDEYIDDASLVTDNVMFTRVHQFSNGFKNNPDLILITAG